MPEFTKRTPLARIAASLAERSSATLSSIGTSTGSVCTGVRQVPTTGCTGASSTGRFCALRAARAMRAASRAASCTASRVIWLVAANPHDPFTSARTPMPYDSESLTAVTCRSRVATNCRRYRPTRASAYDAPASRAAFSASMARSRMPASPGRVARAASGMAGVGVGAVSGRVPPGEQAAATAAAEAVLRKSRLEGDITGSLWGELIAHCGLRIFIRNPQSPISSFVPQGKNGVEARCPPSRPDAKDNAYHRGEQEGKAYRQHRDVGVPVHRFAQHRGRAHAQDHADQAAQQAEHDRLDQELEQNVDARGAERLPHADLAGSLGDRHQHDVHDADSPDEEGHRRDPEEEDTEHLGRLLERREEVRLVADLEVVVASRPQPMLTTQDLLDLRHRVWDLLFALREHVDRAQPVRSHHTKARGLERDQHEIVGILKAASGALPIQNADHLELNSANPYGLPNERLGRLESEVLHYGGAEHGHALAAVVLAVGEHLPCGEAILPNLEVVRGRSDDLRVRVLVDVLHLEL